MNDWQRFDRLFRGVLCRLHPHRPVECTANKPDRRKDPNDSAQSEAPVRKAHPALASVHLVQQKTMPPVNLEQFHWHEWRGIRGRDDVVEESVYEPILWQTVERGYIHAHGDVGTGVHLSLNSVWIESGCSNDEHYHLDVENDSPESIDRHVEHGIEESLP